MKKIYYWQYFYLFIKKYQGLFLFLFISLFFLIAATAQAVSAPENLTAQSAGPDQINLAWEYSDPTIIEGYSVYQGGEQISLVTAGGAHGDYYIEFSDTDLLPLTIYTYYVTAFNSEGEESSPSNPAQATTSNPPTPPTITDVGPVIDPSPMISWMYSDPESNDMSAYRIIVYVQSDDTQTNYNLFSREMWDSGKIPKQAANGATVSAYYNDADGNGDNNDSYASPLDWEGFQGTDDYYFRVQVWDNNGLASELSEAFSFQPQISGSLIYERFDNNDQQDLINTTADWNIVYGEARLESFATVDSYKTIVSDGTAVKPAAVWGGSNSNYYLVYFKRITGNYGLYYRRFHLDENEQIIFDIDEITLDGDLGTTDSVNLQANLSCDLINNRCGVVYTEMGVNLLDAYFLEINSQTGAITILPIQLNVDIDYPKEKAPVIAYGFFNNENKYLVSWFEEDNVSTPFRLSYYTLINRADPQVNAINFDRSQSNIFSSASFNEIDGEFGLIWSRYWEPYDYTNSEIFFNIINWQGEQEITEIIQEGYPYTGKHISNNAPNYSNYPFIKWINVVGGSPYYLIIWKDAREYEFVGPPPQAPEYFGVIDMYFTKIATTGGKLMSDVRLTNFPSRRKYFLSESAVAINSFGKYGLSWLDDRGIGNTNNTSPSEGKTFNSYFMQFSYVNQTTIEKSIYDSLFSTVQLPFPQQSATDETVDSQRGVILSQIPTSGSYFSQIFDQGGDIYLQNLPNQNDNFYLFNLTDKVIQSQTIVNNPNGISQAILYASDTRPGGTSVTYYLSNDGGTNWEQVTAGQVHDFDNPNGTQLKWKAELNSANQAYSPKIGSLAFLLEMVPPNPPDNLKVDNWGPPQITATTTENFSPQLSWTYSDPRGLLMSAFRMQVCAEPFDNNLGSSNFSRCPKNKLMWDTGKVSQSAITGATFEVSYNDSCNDGCADDDLDSHGRPLDWRYNNNYDYYFWQVKVWNSEGLESVWSNTPSNEPSEPSAKFRYGDEVTTNLIFTDDIKTTNYKGAVSLNNSPEYYIGVQGEVRLQANWPTGGTLNGTVVDGTDNVGKYTTIAFDAKNLPHICYYDETNNRLKYASYNGTSWDLEAVNNNGDGGYNCSLAIDHNDQPHLSYYNQPVNPDTKADLMYTKKDGTDWIIETVETDALDADYTFSNTSIVVDSENLPSISYYYKPLWSLRSIRVARFNGTAWLIEIIEAGAADNSLAVDSNNNYHLAYRFGNTLKYASSTGPNNWSTSSSAVYDNGIYVIKDISLDLNNENQPGISFNTATDNTGGSKLRYAYKTTNWTIQDLYDYNNAQNYTDIKYDSLDQPHIVFNGGSWDLFYIYYNNQTGWSGVITLDANGNIGRYPAIAFDNSDLSRLSYWRQSEGDLMYLRKYYQSGVTGSISSINVNPTTNTIYGVRFHASFSNPTSAGTLTFSVSANGGSNWVNPETGQTGCLKQPDGCPVNFAAQGAGSVENWTGNDLRWRVDFITSNQNYTPKVGSVALEVYNIPPVVNNCTYFPPAVDPGQEVTITATVIDESSGIQTRWCFDTDGASGQCPSPPSSPSWTLWQGGTSVNYTYDNANIYNPAVQAKDQLGQQSQPYTCPNLFVGNVTIAWLETKFGNIYSQGNIFGYGVPSEVSGQRNATYKIEAGGQIIGFTNISQSESCRQSLCTGLGEPYYSQCEAACFVQYAPIVNFPKVPYFRNALVDLKAEPVIKTLLENPTEPPLDFWESHFVDLDPASPYNPGYADVADLDVFWTDYYADFPPDYQHGNIYYVKDSRGLEIPLNDENQTNPIGGWCGDVKGFKNAELWSSGDGLIVIDGDLHIYSGYYGQTDEYGNCLGTRIPTSTPKIIYSNTPPISRISDLASVAFIIKGDLIIEPDVEELAGTFIILGKDNVDCSQNQKDYTINCGTVYTAGREPFDKMGDIWIPIANRKPLKINGLVIAKNFQLGRHYFDWETNQAGEVFINDGRAILNPPPGLEDIISSLPNWRTKLAP